ncbi:MAG: hypothetical protein WC749_13225, partial [Dehalococcoidia bacterium]
EPATEDGSGDPEKRRPSLPEKGNEIRVHIHAEEGVCGKNNMQTVAGEPQADTIPMWNEAEGRGRGMK